MLFEDPVEVDVDGGEVGVSCQVLFALPCSDVGLMGGPYFAEAGVGERGEGARLHVVEAVVPVGGGADLGHLGGVGEVGRGEFLEQPLLERRVLHRAGASSWSADGGELYEADALRDLVDEDDGDDVAGCGGARADGLGFFAARRIRPSSAGSSTRWYAPDSSCRTCGRG
ncbi:hypothetical protein [Streptomyces rimosus]|uniref:hypothetical protein n=1 Tax=Streptomyces rimosus TaxID=1927 RepID=UPI0037CF1C30